MKAIRIAILWGLCSGPAWLPADEVPANSGEAGVRSAAQAYVTAFNSHDAAAVGRLWTEQAVYLDRITGERTEGREAIQADLAEVFQQHPEIRLQLDAGRVRFIRPEIAQAESTATVFIPDQDPNVVAVTAIFVKAEDGWLLDSVEELSLPTPESAVAALAELEWLVGDWRDDSESVSATSTFRWGAAGSFLIRSFAVSTADGPASEGTQVIGWDPRLRHIRSWTFNSDGSFGEAVWSRNGGDWLIKSTQTQSDGATATGTYVLTPVDQDSMTVQLIGHEIDGVAQATAPAVRVVRSATPAPQAEAVKGGGP